jgi:hypothetical protein
MRNAIGVSERATFYPWLNSLNCFAIDDLNGAPSDNFVRRIANAE